MARQKGTLVRLKELRGDMTWEEVATKTGIPKGTMFGYSSGYRSPQNENLEKLCKAFNVNHKWLLTGKGEKYRGKPKAVKIKTPKPPTLSSVFLPIPPEFHLSADHEAKEENRLLKKLVKCQHDLLTSNGIL
jgi:transcriptional regulator with XRE-family HTH domain